MLPDSLDPDTLRTVSIGALALLAVLALFVLRVVQRVMTKILLIGLLVAIAAGIWWQRDKLSDCAETCDCRFAGFEVPVPDIAQCPD
ncbi:MAG: hypothetical protein ACRD0U_13510 [Acidimicrobiales bacterium]